MIEPPLLNFRIYPGAKGGLYFGVQLFATRAQMLIWCHWTCQDSAGSYQAITHQGITRSYKSDRRGRTYPGIGNIHFYRAYSGAAVVAHECTHAAVFWARRKWRCSVLQIGDELQGKFTVGDREERLAVVVETLVGQILNRWAKAGITIS